MSGSHISGDPRELLGERGGTPHVDAPAPRTFEFAQALCSLLNGHSMENASNTPDFILRDFLIACLVAFDTTTQQREAWYGRSSSPTYGRVHAQPPGVAAVQDFQERVMAQGGPIGLGVPVLTSGIGKCVTCQYWHTYDAITEAPSGACHRRAPTILHDAHNAAAWPITNRRDTCGDYEARPPIDYRALAQG